MKICPRCGRPNGGSNRVCDFCGNQFPNRIKAKPQNQMKIVLLVIMSMLLAVFVLVAGMLMFRKAIDSKTTDTGSNPDQQTASAAAGQQTEADDPEAPAEEEQRTQSATAGEGNTSVYTINENGFFEIDESLFGCTYEEVESRLEIGFTLETPMEWGTGDLYANWIDPSDDYSVGFFFENNKLVAIEYNDKVSHKIAKSLENEIRQKAGEVQSAVVEKSASDASELSSIGYRKDQMITYCCFINEYVEEQKEVVEIKQLYNKSSYCLYEGEQIRNGNENAASDTESIDWHLLMEYKEPVPSESNPERRMAHNIYSNPLLDEMSGKYSGFLIDFCSDHDAVCTYWSLCNWSMDTTELASRYTVTDNGWAYAGLQNTLDGKTAIMSFWDIHYNDENGNDTVIRAKQIYPNNTDVSSFSGEGEGANRIQPYEWKAGHWYRMYLNCYENGDTGHTHVEQWVQNIDTDKWTEISCFDTGLSGSFMTGDMSQFMENYDWEHCNEVRSGSIRNIFVRDYDSGEWIPVTKSKLSVDTWYGNKKGSFAFDAGKRTLYGITCGYGDDTAQSGEDISKVFTLEHGTAAETP